MTVSKFTLPDVGEGLTEAEIVEWKVAPGDTVTINQVLVEIETAKSLVELPSPFVGVVGEILVPAGTTVDVGTPIITIRSDAASDAAAAPGADVPAPIREAADAAADVANTITEDGSAAVLVGRGAAATMPTRRKRHSGARVAHESMAPPAAASARPAATPLPQQVPGAPVGPVFAKPPIRKLAKDLGVDLSQVTPTGPIGDVTREDVLREATQVSVFRNIETPEWPADREERIPVKGVRKAIAQAMVKSAFTAPHVSLFVDVDATRTMEFVKRLKASTDFAGVRVSPLLIMAKAMIWAVRRNPTVNSTFTDDEVIIRHYVNLGIAAATPRGLIVPNIKEAQDMSLLELASALERLTIIARDGKTSPAEMAGGTITITNIGVFGMDTGTPILNAGEAGIVALGTIKQKPWVVDGEVRVRYVTTIGASFDHRVVDGDVASRFLADVASIIEEPALLLE
ncbi:2-oxo acid dehydrogenase subunit E2 [Cryobacterium sp. Sr8]|uniref:Dihydrolipoamide acetyltransferase component of pyruvate dehydrogenase complex n=1 Tax=Cryobacterium psychrotolerans TaxID=386301 RepID=A0A1G9BHP5_9MICO|nr:MULTISPECIES: dihydrolipoamide acetyltransferase family protein [Cryobacterium]TFD46217.1 2-oxo acid dehydrogenase subunit E2 [Cryobacterium sp. TMT1-2-1]TFD74947.1 2-oxo acid dehydrogenase subunit E2 [Cryobacterium sp. Sr8]TFD84750.1 2-oxo acid dehydrogenase subunit E2 [Cryobacterium psychrotolerans]SDK39036.1 pyruvate dehydrogenase E2 component (dihydrolipoamide acetyltransferase) [Cryobacterium psychrotolerans]